MNFVDCFIVDGSPNTKVKYQNQKKAVSCELWVRYASEPPAKEI